jgi:hypothetical protein
MLFAHLLTRANLIVFPGLAVVAWLTPKPAYIALWFGMLPGAFAGVIHAPPRCPLCPGSQPPPGAMDAGWRRALLRLGHCTLIGATGAVTLTITGIVMADDSTLGRLLFSSGCVLFALGPYALEQHERLRLRCPFCCRGTRR